MVCMIRYFIINIDANVILMIVLILILIIILMLILILIMILLLILMLMLMLTMMMMMMIHVSAMTEEELAQWKRRYERESFPGLEVSLEDITGMMTAPDPKAGVGAKAISQVGEYLSSVLE